MALFLIGFGVAAARWGLNAARTVGSSVAGTPGAGDAVTGGLVEPTDPPEERSGSAAPSCFARVISGYIWDSPELVPPRDDGVFRLVPIDESILRAQGIDPETSYLVWEHPYGGEIDLPILMYHSVSRPAKNLCVTPEDLRRQMEVLKSAGYTGITLETALLYARGVPVRMPPKPVVLTFDDGYKDFSADAMPVLDEFGFRATVFIIGDLVGRSGYMSWDDVREAAQAGHEIGCHTMTHPDLRDLGRDSLVRQIMTARDAIESKSGIRPASFCYPAGKFSEQIRSIVVESGYLGAVTTSPGWASTTDDLYLLNRIRVDGTAGLGTFKSQMNLGEPR